MHILLIPEMGVRIVLSCHVQSFNWSEWVLDCVKDEEAPPEMRTISLLLLASGIR